MNSATSLPKKQNLVEESSFRVCDQYLLMKVTSNVLDLAAFTQPGLIPVVVLAMDWEKVVAQYALVVSRPNDLELTLVPYPSEHSQFLLGENTRRISLMLRKSDERILYVFDYSILDDGMAQVWSLTIVVYVRARNNTWKQVLSSLIPAEVFVDKYNSSMVSQGKKVRPKHDHSLNVKGLGSKLYGADQARQIKSLTLEEKNNLLKSPKKDRSKNIQKARDGKYSRVMRPQSGIFDILRGFNLRVDKASADRVEDLLTQLSSTSMNVEVNHSFDIMKPLALVGFASAIIMIMWQDNSRDWKKISAACGIPLAALGVPLIKEYIKRFHSDEIKPQINTGSITKLAGLLFMGTSYMTMGSPNDPKNFEKLILKASIFDRAKGGLFEALSLAVEIIERAVNYLRENLLGLKPVEILQKDLPGLRTWCNEVEALVDSSRAGTLSLNTETSAVVYRLEREARNFESLRLNASDSLQVRSAMSAYRAILRSLVQRFEQANMTGNGVRMQPIALLNVGASGAGKSEKADPFLRRFVDRIVDPSLRESVRRNYYDFVYPYQVENKYMDGYRQQLVVYMDDWGQNRDVPGNLDNEYNALIRMVNTVPFVCHMADISSKGNTPFVSKIVYVTSNVTSIRPSSIICPEAVVRRFDYIYCTVPKQEFSVGHEADPMKRKLDVTHPTLNGDSYANDLHEYHIMRSDVGGVLRPTGQTMSEDDFLEMCVSKYRARERHFAKYTKFLDTDVWRESVSKDDVEMTLVPHTSRASEWSEEGEVNVDDVFSYIRENYCPEALGLSSVELYDELNNATDGKWLCAYETKDYSDCDVMFFDVESDLKRKNSGFITLSDKLCVKFHDTRSKMAELLASLVTRCRSRLVDLESKYPMLFALGKWLAFAGVACLGYKIFKQFMFPEIDEMGFETGGPRRPGKMQVRRVSVTNRMHAEAARDHNAEEVAHKVTRKSHYEILLESSSERFGLGVFVGGKVLMVPHHYIHHLEALISEDLVDPSDYLLLRNQYLKKTLRVQVREFIAERNRNDLLKNDITFIHLGSLPYHHPQIAKLFLTEEQLNKPIDLYLSIFGIDKSQESERFHAYGKMVRDKSVTDHERVYTVAKAVMYQSHISPGDCGYLTLLSNLSVGPGKIVGMHVAGSDNGTGMSACVTFEDVERVLHKYKDVDYPACEDTLLKPQCLEVPFDGEFVPLFRAEKKVTQPVVSKYVPSPLHGKFGPPNRFPAVLRTIDGVDPLAKAIEKYGLPKKKLDLKLVRRAGKMLERKVRKVMTTFRKPRTLSFEQACRGIPEVEFLNAIPRNTSAGYPYVLNPEKGFKGKEWFFGTDEEYDFTRPQMIQLRKDVERVIELAKLGKRSLHVFVDTKKDELRKLSKIEKAETRLISAIPLVLAVVSRMYFLDFSVFTMERNQSLGVGVGLNCYSDDWDMLGRRMQTKGKKVVAGDFSGFDTSTQEALYVEIVRIINVFYEESDRAAEDFDAATIRRVLFADLYNSIHIFLDFVYQWLSCMPSGHILTAIVNSLVVLLLMYMVWLLLGLDTKFVFEDEIEIDAYGDDNILNISDAVIDEFNQITIAKAMDQFGFVYTDDLKSDTLVPYRDLSEVTYLKRYFRYEPLVKRYVAPLEIDSIRKSLDWVKKCATSDQIIRDNVDNALVEFSLHSRQDFQKWAPLVVAVALEVLDHNPVRTDRMELLLFSTKVDNYW